MVQQTGTVTSHISTRLLPFEQVAGEFNISPKSLMRYCARHEIPIVRAGNNKFITYTERERLIVAMSLVPKGG